MRDQEYIGTADEPLYIEVSAEKYECCYFEHCVLVGVINPVFRGCAFKNCDLGDVPLKNLFWCMSE